jgi:hypothetical protein
MDLLDRYIAAVRKYLPWQRQNDIVAELKANLESQLEDKETELGRPLTQPEMEQWLKELGPPIQMAARYQPQRYLIGPAIFPFYWYVLRMAFTWAMVIYSIVTVVQMFSAPEPNATALLDAVLRVPMVLLTTATWVTLIFAGIEYAAGRYPATFQHSPIAASGWSPVELPPVVDGTGDGGKPRSYAQSVAEVIFGFIFLAWLLLVPEHPYLLLGPGAAYLKSSPYQAAPVLMQFFWAVVALNIFQLGWRAESLWRGRWRRRGLAQQIAFKILGLIPLLLLLTARDHAYVVLKHPAADWAARGATLDATNHGIYKAMLLVFVIAFADLLWTIGKRSLAAYRKRAAAIR